MALSAIGLAALEAREGNRRVAYRDSRGVWTIGLGVTSASGLIKVTRGLTLTAAECAALNARAVAQYAAAVDKALHGTIPPQHTYDALVSCCYNIGVPGFVRSGFLKHVKAGNMEAAKQAMLLWRRPAEIVPRRQGEADQLVTPYSVRLPSARRGEPPVRVTASAKAISTTPAVPARKLGPAPIPRPAPPRATASALPAWWLAIARAIDVMFGPRLPAH